MRWLGLFNFLVMQWYFCRVARFYDDVGQPIGYGLVGPVLPMTGWAYVPVRPRTWRIV